MYDLNQFTLKNMSECGLTLRQLGKNAESMEAVGTNIVQHLYENLVDYQTSKKSCALIQLFKTHSYNDLTPDLQAKLRQNVSYSNISPSLKCLTRLAMVGELSENQFSDDIATNEITPLIDETAIANNPMVAQLIHQLGLMPEAVLQPNAVLATPTEQPLYNVFFIPEVLDSPYMLAQPELLNSVKSVVGFGGLLPSGDLFAVVLFLKVKLSPAAVDFIRPLALSIKAAILPFDQDRVFAAAPVKGTGTELDSDDHDRTIKQLRAQVATLTQLLNVAEQATLNQSERLEQAMGDRQQALQQLQQTQTQMVHSEKMASLGAMVTEVAHEIYNPVNFIFGNITYAIEYTQDVFELLELYRHHYPQPLPPIQAKIDEMDLDFVTNDLTKLLSSMKMGAERSREIVRSLRTFSRQDEAAYQPANIHEGLNSTLLILQHRLKAQPDQAEIQVIKDYGDIPYIDCYPGQLNQVFMTILSNAFDALEKQTPPSTTRNPTNPGPAIAGIISIRTSMLGKDWIRICIADNRARMSNATKTNLLDPFLTTQPIGKGTGSGLAISHQIVVDHHSGKLICRSTPGQGVEFVIDLPIWKQAAIANQPTATITSPDLVGC